jgi:hypothetical protein
VRKLPLAWSRSTWAEVLLLSCFVFLLLFDSTRSLHIHTRDWQADDGCYIQHLGDYLGIEGGNICVRPVNYFARGVALLWFVPGLIGKFIAHGLGQNVTRWILPIVAVSSYVFWAIGLYFLVLILKERRWKLDLKGAWLAIFALLTMFNTFSLHYGTVRLFLAHSAEVMLSLGLVYFTLQDEFVVALLFAVFLSVTRYNDAPAVLLIVGRFLDTPRAWKSLPKRTLALIGIGVFGVLAAGAWIAFYEGYYFTTIGDLLEAFQWQNLAEFLWSPRWGMLWSGSWWLAALGIGIARFHRQSNLARAATIWVALEAFLGIIWGGNGSDFGYRYLIGSYPAALLVWLEFVESMSVARVPFKILTAANGIWVALMTIVYQAVPQTDVHWDPTGVSCEIPPRLTLLIFENLLNPDAYVNSFSRRIVPLALYLSRNPAARAQLKNYDPLVGSEFTIMAVLATACVFYIVAHLAARFALSRKSAAPKR